METSKYFFIDKISIKEKNKFIFRYTDYQTEKTAVKMSKYPIYIMMHEDCINFYYFGHLKAGKKISIINNLLFSININSDKYLTKSLKELFQFNIPFINLKNLKNNKQEKIYKGFSELHIFEKEKSNSNDQFLKFLFLDFMYDFNFHDIFQNSKYYNNIKGKLLANNLFNGILLKYIYLLKKDRHKEFYRQKNIDKSYNKHLKDTLNYSMKNWIDYIISEDGTKTISKNNWFEDVENEIKNVDIFEIDEKKEKEIASWFLGRYNLTKALKSLFYNSKPTKLLVLGYAAFILLLQFFYYIIKNFIDFFTLLNQVGFLKNIIQFNYTIIRKNSGIIIDGFIILTTLILFFILIRKNKLDNIITLSLPKLSLALAVFWLAYLNGKWELGFPEAYLFFASIIPIILFTKIQIRYFSEDLNKKQNLKRSFGIISYSIVASISIALFFNAVMGDADYIKLLVGVAVSLYIAVFSEFILKEKQITQGLY